MLAKIFRLMERFLGASKGHIRIEIPNAGTNLTPEQLKVEERARQSIQNHLGSMKREYRRRFGSVVATDFARELFPEYAASRDARTLYGAAVQKSAAVLANEVFEDLLKQRHPKTDPIALFTAGGTGAGKTTTISSHDTLAGMYSKARIIYDSNLNSFSSAKKKIDRALGVGLSVAIFYVHRDPVESFIDGVLPRALEDGRVVSIATHARLHSECIKNIRRLVAEYSDLKDKIRFYVIENKRGERPRLRGIELLSHIKYHRNILVAEITAILESDYVGKVPEPINTAIRIQG